MTVQVARAGLMTCGCSTYRLDGGYGCREMTQEIRQGPTARRACPLLETSPEQGMVASP
ncbi:MAG: hypothetical protein HWN67_10285 [Candidatus Helarchaeota archaeon]|nr:hypothetical protein [Candidatus Helarchaeota archaeon]